MAAGRYYVVDAPAKKILSGPLVLDSALVATWPVQPGGTLITEAAMQSGGYTWPLAPVDPAVTILAKIPQAIAANNAFLALAAPTNAQVVQQVQRMTRQLNALGRLAAQLLDDTSDS